jgi:hypothetical protein
MNSIRRILGVLWIAVGLYAGYYLFINQALPMWGKGGTDLVPAIIYTFILAPIIAGGMSVLGYYALTGEYDQE